MQIPLGRYTLALFGTLMGRRAQDILRMILTGVILGVLFRSGAGLMARMMDPNDFALVQAASLASFTRIDMTILPVAGAPGLAAIGAALTLSERLDLLALGRGPAIALGLVHDRLAIAVLALVAVRVSVATAQVGPATFFGRIVAGLARDIVRAERHDQMLRAAVLVGGLLIVCGQTVFERLPGLQSGVAVESEFAGGLFFLWLLLNGRLRWSGSRTQALASAEPRSSAT